MWTIFKKGVEWLAGLLTSLAWLKSFFVGAIAVIMSALAAILTGFLDVTIGSIMNLPSLLGALPNDFLFYFDVFEFDVGIALLLGALITRFLIRRIPVIG